VTKGLRGADNGEELFIVDVIILFGIDQGFGVVGNGVPPIKEVWLFKNCANSKVASVSDKTERMGAVREQEDRCHRKAVD